MKIINRDHSQILLRSSKIIVKIKIIQILLFLAIVIIPIQSAEVYAQSVQDTESNENKESVSDDTKKQCTDGKVLEGKQCVSECAEGTISDGTQCVLRCGDGTKLEGGICVRDIPILGGEIEFIAYGIITGVGATAFGIAWTVKQRRNEAKKEDMELIQKYGEELTNVINTEKDLTTKFDCELYAEQYLNILEQIASLYHKDMLRHEVAGFFESYFRYGVSLWKWYKKNVENYPDYEIEIQLTEGLDKHQRIVTDEAEERIQSDRWFYFRWFVNGGDPSV